MTLRVFEVRGVCLFRTDREVAPPLRRHYNAAEDRYEVPSRADLDALDPAWELVEDPDRFRVRFVGTPPASVAEAALLLEEGPGTTTALCPDEAAVERALAAGGDRVGGAGTDQRPSDT